MRIKLWFARRWLLEKGDYKAGVPLDFIIIGK